MRPNDLPTNEWSYWVDTSNLDQTKSIAIEADSDQRIAVAKRFDIEAIGSLSAALNIEPESSIGRYRVHGQLEALVTRICSRTGETFTQDIKADVEGFFADKQGTVSFIAAKKKRDEEFGEQPNFVDEAEDPEPLIHGHIDLGELTAQNLALALDPYPLSPNAPDLPQERISDTQVNVDNPFAVLSELREFMDKE